ncbi:hypothetical protein CDL12_28198 [Handroanthus impetiginosus]|uniref:Uncharacterized protein n=1 Tax=Handroanthus impetiginosus TaxID=429701 RepID=A0A2G9G2E2_9LAMI|nr:hypothetical protein CDL12_28198 [Handroanthus impetiginosus]
MKIPIDRCPAPLHTNALEDEDGLHNQPRDAQPEEEGERANLAEPDKPQLSADEEE